FFPSLFYNYPITFRFVAHIQRMRIAAKVVKGFKSLAFILKKCTAIYSITFSLRIQQSFSLGLAR
ncbi:MAG: hypothetical protein ACI3ZY_09625, partial [Parabacteroides sp.]